MFERDNGEMVLCFRSLQFWDFVFRRCRRAACTSFLVLFALTAPGLLAQSTQTDGAKAPADQISTAGRSAAKAAPTAPIQPPPPGFDVAGRSQQVLSHLNAVIRYYRMIVTPIQQVGEPSDALYRDQAITDTKQAALYAFQSGKAEASLLVAYQKQQGSGAAPGSEGEAQRLQAARNNVATRITALQAQQQALDQQIGHARPKQIEALRAQQEQIEGALALNSAMSEALGKIVSMSDTQGRAGLAGDVERLLRTAPELTDTKARPPATPLENFSSERSAGVSSQAITLFHLLNTLHSIDQVIAENNSLHQQALDLRTPITNILRSMVQKGQALSQQAVDTGAPAISDAQQLQQMKEAFASVTATFKILSAASVPLSQEIITLEQSRANLLAWRSAVNAEYHSVLRILLLRILVIAIVLAVLFTIGEIWRRGTTRYVHDLRRRRQLLIMRRLVIGFLSAIVILFGFVTQFNSLATFAGFITAGLAVGLQTILLSVAAYFFIIGRYGVRVGDRITVANVTGDVIEVGLVRFYVMELAGSGTELQQTGRVAVFSNAILFQAGTPLYKQMPGTEYAWHELTASLKQTGEYTTAAEKLVESVTRVYDTYREHIEQQHRDLESWMDTRIEVPVVSSRLQLLDSGLQLFIRYPVEIRSASRIDQQITEAMLTLIQNDETVKQSVAAPPAIKAAVKG